LVVQPKGKGSWADVVRTPLGLIPEGHGRYTMFYTGYQNPRVSGQHPFGGVGFVTVKESSDSAVGSAGH
jgi:hypothetical protein